MKEIALIYGGVSGEHEISIRSARFVDEHLDRSQYHLSCFYIRKDGEWTEGDSVDPDAAQPCRNPFEQISKASCALILVHGETGEDGVLQSFCQLAKVPYATTSAATSFLTMDKHLTKLALKDAGLPVVPWVVLRKSDQSSLKIAENFMAQFKGRAIFVKPIDAGSSLGVTRIQDGGELADAVRSALRYSQGALLEPAVKGREFECAALQSIDSSSWTITAVSEIIVSDPSRFYDYDAKYIDAETARISLLEDAKLTRRIQALTENCLAALNITSMSRVDFLYDTATDQIYINEVNSIPGMTSISQFPKLLVDAGIPNREILSTLIENARHRCLISAL